MSGHNKWSKIKRDKASNDAKRGAIFTKLGNQIAVAARQGTDPQTNTLLATTIETAKSFNMPQSTIERALKRATDKSQADLEEILYEGYGVKALAILVVVATDNRKRTYPEVKSAFAKNGGNIAEEGSVAFNFKHCGEISVKTTDEQAILKLLELGAEDVIEDQSGFLIVITPPQDLHQVLKRIKADNSFEIEEAGLSYLPKNKISLDIQSRSKAEKLIEALDSLDDVLNVYTNLSEN